MGEKAKLAKPVVDRDDDDIFRHQIAWIVAIAFADDESAAVDPDHHGKEVRAPLVGLGGGKNVQEQAILGRARRSVGRSDLRAVGAEARGVANAVPALGLLRRAPPKVADGCRGVRDSAELLHRASGDTPHRARVRSHDRRLGCRRYDGWIARGYQQRYGCYGDTVLDPAPHIALPAQMYGVRGGTLSQGASRGQGFSRTRCTITSGVSENFRRCEIASRLSMFSRLCRVRCGLGFLNASSRLPGASLPRLAATRRSRPKPVFSARHALTAGATIDCFLQRPAVT